jgi:hypothetical protein
VESSCFKTNPGKCWSLFKSLSGKNTRSPPNQRISFSGKIYTKSPDIAKNFLKQFTKSVNHKMDRHSITVIRNLQKKHQLDSGFQPFTCLATCDAINASKSFSAVGPDGLTAIHLKHIGPHAITYLTALFNLSVSKADLPTIWKDACIFPIQKPGKPTDLGPSYRPISLLSPAVKVLPIVTAALPKSNTQHGFAPDHSCTTTLLPIATKVVRCLYGTALSSRMIIHTVVPQGSVLSPALFNFFTSDCPGNADVLSIYADDFSGTESDSNLTSLSAKLQAVVTPIADWAAGKKLCIAPAKSQVTLFTPCTQQFNVCPDISIDGVDIPLCRNPKILGVTFDTMFSFAQHILSIATKALQRLKILKAVSGSSWGHNKETL